MRQIGIFAAALLALTSLGAEKSAVMFIPAKQLLSDVRSTPERVLGVSVKDYIDNSTAVLTVLRRTKPLRAELHKDVVDIWYVVEGGGTLVTGGSLAGPITQLPNDEKWQPNTTTANELRAPSISGGDERHISKGDVVVIPPDVPHWVSKVDGEIVYLVVKVPPGN
jgi:mannose-6-phosphate isomerase-like protein (cupin superfamily)